MAKGDYRLILETPFQQVESHPRRYGVMFSPSSSRSRLHIVDGGWRYAVRLLTDGSVQYSVDGEASWRSIQPLADPCTGQLLPAFILAKRDALGGDMQTVLEGLRADFTKRDSAVRTVGGRRRRTPSDPDPAPLPIRRTRVTRTRGKTAPRRLRTTPSPRRPDRGNP
jgi:hypothetical protein